MTNEILELMDKRREVKNKDLAKYNCLQRVIRSNIRQAKLSWLNAECSEIERLQNFHDDFHLHKKIKETSGLYKQSTSNLLFDNNNNLVLEEEEKANVWEQFINNLFGDATKSNIDDHQQGNFTGPPITKEEIQLALKSAKNKKAVGPDEIPSEIIKLLSYENISILEKIFNGIYDSGVYPREWLKSTFIALPKARNAKKCNEYRLISLMSHMLKIFLKVLHNRLFRKCEERMGTTQFGFKEAMGTRDALFSLHVLIQNCKDVQKDVFICFIDYEKAFDRVQHDKLIEILTSIGLDNKDIRLIKNLYWKQEAELKFNEVVVKNLVINRGVRQGCILSPLLFNIYSERIFEESISSLDKGIKVNGTFINNIRYADDTTLIADSLEDLQIMLSEVNKYSNKAGLNMNIKKTKFMIISRNRLQYTDAAILVNNKPVERVTNFKYLGCWLTEEWNSDKEIKCRIEMARSSFYKFKKVICNNNISLQLRIRCIKCYVWSILLYGVEAWTLKISTMNKIEAFEMWCYRRLLKIPWTDKVTNEDVLRRVNKERELLRFIKIRKTLYFGHIIRGSKYELLQLIVEGRIQGRRGMGRKQMSWLRNIRNWTGLRTIGELVHTARNRENFNDIISNIM